MKGYLLFFTLLTINISGYSQSGFACKYIGMPDTTPYVTIVGEPGAGSKWSAVPMDDITFRNVPMFMTFNFNGVDYTTFSISSNGYIWFGTGTPAIPATSNPLSVPNLGANVHGIIVPCGRDLQGHPDLQAGPQRPVNGLGHPYSIFTLLSGTAPNRVTTIEWVGFYPKGITAGSCFNSPDNHRLDFQIKLHEHGGINSDRIEFIYRDQSPFCCSQPYSFAVGLRGASDTDYVNRVQSAGNFTSTSSLPGTANTDVINFTGGDRIVGSNTGVLFDYTTAASVNISSSTATYCPGVPVDFTALVTNGGSSPAYQWKVNGLPVGTDSSVYHTSSLNNGDTVVCEVVSSSPCANGLPAVSNAIVVVYSQDTASVSIAASDSSICSGQGISFYALPVHGGTSPAYQWQVNGVTRGTDSIFYTTSLAHGDVVTCQMVSTANCVTGSPALSAPLNAVVRPALSPSVSILSSDTAICTGTAVSFTALAVNGGPTPVYQWLVNGSPAGSNAAAFTTTGLNHGDRVSCVLTSSEACTLNPVDTSAGIIMAVSNLAVAGNISATADTICTNDTAQLTVTGYAGTIQWQLSASGSSFADVPGATASTYQDGPVSQPAYYRVLAVNGPCRDTSAVYLLNIKPVPVPPRIDGQTLFCSGDSTRLCIPDTFISYQWNNGDTSACSYVKLAGGSWVTVTASNGCATVSNRLNVAVYPPFPVSLIVNSDTLFTFNGSAYQWYYNDTALPGATAGSYIARQPGSYSVEVTDSNGCRAFSSKVSIGVSGIFQPAAPVQFSIYPNPVGAGMVNLMAAKQLIGEMYRVYNLQGRMVEQGTIVQPVQRIDFSQYPSGAYLVKVLEMVVRVVKY